MKPVNVCLSKSEISAILSSDLPPDETVSAEQHIADCETCRAMIESMIGDSRWWNDAQQSLAAFFMRNRPEADVSHEAEPTTSEQMFSLLGPTDDPDKIGRIAEYEVIGIIGRGGMGVVFKAFDPRLNRFVAIKMLLPHLAASGAARKRFAREGQAAAAVVDDFVLPIYAVAEWKGVPYLVTQYSRGTTLQKRVQSEGPLEVKEILRLGMQTSRGLAAAHAQGLVHRDVKPSNILLDGSVERAMLTDFGLARAVDDASITRTGVIAGTPQYMSPEQARGQSVDARSDLFSLGCVLYFLCTGHPPFRADNSYAILRLITDEEPRSIREINPDIPVWLCSIVQKLMAKNAEDRYGSAMDVAELLEACLAHVQQPTTARLPTDLKLQASTKLLSATFRRRVPIMLTMLTAAILICFWISPEESLLLDNATSNPNAAATVQEAKVKATNGSVLSVVATTIPGVDHLKADLKTLLDLTSEKEQQQWENVTRYVDILVEGIEESRPIEIQHIPSLGESSTLVWVPLPTGDNSFRAFRQTLDSLGYSLQKQNQASAAHDLYQLNMPQLTDGNEQGWIRIDHKEKRACLALTTRVETMDALRAQVLAATPVATPAECTFAMTMTNADHSGEAQEYRRRAFQSYRDQAIKQLAAEKGSFLPATVREWLIPIWLDEYALLSAEGSTMSARFHLDRSKTPLTPSASVDLTASAIPNSWLASSISQLSSADDAYASITPTESPTFSVHLNTPISRLQKENLQSLNQTMVTQLQKALHSEHAQTDGSWGAATTLADGVRRLVSDTIETSRLNAFIEGNVIDGNAQWIGSIVTPNAQLTGELLSLLPQLDSENKLKLNVQAVGTAAIHRVEIGGMMLEHLQTLLKTDGHFYVACDTGKLWIASGHNALGLLVNRIETLGPPQPSSAVVQANVNLESFIDGFLIVPEATPSASSTSASSTKADAVQSVLRLVRDCCGDDDDTLNLEVTSSVDQLKATVYCEAAILRMIGKEIARFSQQNFE